MIRFNEYQAQDQNFILVDGCGLDLSRFKKRNVARSLCVANDADSLVVIENSSHADFGVSVFGRDGIEICASPEILASAVAFADVIGIKVFHTQNYTVENRTDVHSALICSHLGETKQICVDGSEPIEVLNLGDLLE